MHLRVFLGLVLLMPTVMVMACSAHNLHAQIMSAYDRTDDPISGDWQVTFKVHDTTTPATFTLKLDGEKVTGTVYSDHTGAGTIREGSWVNEKLNFIVDFKKHESIAIAGTLKEGKLSGEFRTEGFVSNWEAIKKIKSE